MIPESPQGPTKRSLKTLSATGERTQRSSPQAALTCSSGHPNHPLSLSGLCERFDTGEAGPLD